MAWTASSLPTTLPRQRRHYCDAAARTVAIPILCFFLGTSVPLYSGLLSFGNNSSTTMQLNSDETCRRRNDGRPDDGEDATSSTTTTTSTDDRHHLWNSIDVYVGPKQHPNSRQFFYSDKLDGPDKWKDGYGPSHPVLGAHWYAEAGQDSLVVQLLKLPTVDHQQSLQQEARQQHQHQPFYYIDLAANNAYGFSNTFALDRLYHWNGLCIETNPKYWLDLARLRSCRVIGAAVGSRRKSSKMDHRAETQQPILFRFGDGSGGLVGSDFDNKDANTERNGGGGDSAAASSYNRHVFVISIRDILQRYHVPNVIDYLSLDVEGAESLVMMDFPFDEYDIKILTGERLKRDLRNLLKKKGYTFKGYLRDWGEGLWINDKYAAQLDLSVIPPTEQYQEPPK